MIARRRVRAGAGQRPARVAGAPQLGRSRDIVAKEFVRRLPPDSVPRCKDKTQTHSVKMKNILRRLESVIGTNIHTEGINILTKSNLR